LVFLVTIVFKSWDLTIPAALGVVVCWYHLRRLSGSMLPVMWLILMLVVFAVHRPWWPHYYVHIAVPLCWCAAIGIVRVWEWFRQWRGLCLRAAAALFALCAVLWPKATVWSIETAGTSCLPGVRWRRRRATEPP
jgi:hypothetical protein